MEQERFVETYHQRGLMVSPTVKILVDRKTGVNYLVLQNGTHVDGITPLLDADGKPLVSESLIL